MTQSGRKSLFEKPLLSTKVKSANVKPVEMLLGYLVGPFCAMLVNGIFTTYLTRYFRDVLFAEELAAGSALAGSIETFLTLFPILSAILIVIGNLVAGQIVERTRTKAGKARPWILLSAVLLAVSGMLIFIQPSNDPTFKMVWLVIAYNLYYAVAFPLYNTANSTLTPLSTRNGKQRSVLASLVNMSLLGATGAGSMIFPILLGLLINDDMTLGEQKNYWLVLFIIVAVITFFGTILQYYFTRERVTEERASVAQKEDKKGASVREQAKRVVNDNIFIKIREAVYDFPYLVWIAAKGSACPTKGRLFIGRKKHENFFEKSLKKERKSLAIRGQVWYSIQADTEA